MVLRIIFLFFLSCGFVGAAQFGSTNKYSLVNTESVRSGYDVFNEITTFSFSANIQTTGEAISEVLLHAGYRLAESSAADPFINHLLDSPLPGLHRQIGPATVLDVLDILSGGGWVVVRDPVHRLVSFDIQEGFEPCGYVAGKPACR